MRASSTTVQSIYPTQSTCRWSQLVTRDVCVGRSTSAPLWASPGPRGALHTMRAGLPARASALAGGAEASSPLGVFGVLDTGSLFHLLSALDGSSLVRLGACRCVMSVCAATHGRGVRGASPCGTGTS